MSDEIVQDIVAYRTSAALSTFVTSGLIFKVSAERAGSLAELCEDNSLDPGNTERLLKFLSFLGYVHLDGDGITLTQKGDELASSSSYLNWVRTELSETYWKIWPSLTSAIRDGSVPFEQEWGQPFFDHLAGNTTLGRHFHDAMTAFSDEEGPLIGKVLDLTDCAVICDVGGGKGTLATCLDRIHPGRRFVVFDRYEGNPPEHPAGNIGFVDGDFFKTQPPEADVYLLKNILHDWPDEDALEILKNVAAAMTPGARAYIIEIVLDPDEFFGHGLDLVMMALFAGKERTLVQFQALAADAGLSLGFKAFADGKLAVLEARHSN